MLLQFKSKQIQTLNISEVFIVKAQSVQSALSYHGQYITNNAKGLEAGLNPREENYNYIFCKKYSILVPQSIHECDMKRQKRLYL